MNNARRAALHAIVERIASIRDDLSAIADEERDYFDAMPPGIQDSEKGEGAQAAIDALEQAGATLEEVESEIEGACE